MRAGESGEYYTPTELSAAVQQLIDDILAGGDIPPVGLGIAIDDQLLALASAVRRGDDPQPAIDAIWAQLEDPTTDMSGYE